MRGLEPPRCHHHRLLRPARLSVPPHPHAGKTLCERVRIVSRKPSERIHVSRRFPRSFYFKTNADSVFGLRLSSFVGHGVQGLAEGDSMHHLIRSDKVALSASALVP